MTLPARLKKLSEDATPGPWLYIPGDENSFAYVVYAPQAMNGPDDRPNCECNCVHSQNSNADGGLIVELRNNTDTIVAGLEWAEKAKAAIESALRGYHWHETHRALLRSWPEGSQ